jgi:hypothetical protein
MSRHSESIDLCARLLMQFLYSLCSLLAAPSRSFLLSAFRLYRPCPPRWRLHRRGRHCPRQTASLAGTRIPIRGWHPRPAPFASWTHRLSVLAAMFLALDISSISRVAGTYSQRSRTPRRLHVGHFLRGPLWSIRFYAVSQLRPRLRRSRDLKGLTAPGGDMLDVSVDAAVMVQSQHGRNDGA